MVALMALGWITGWSGSARADFDPCAEVLHILHSTAADLAAGNHVYRQAPTLVPGRNRTLAVDLLIKRSNIFIGPYRVEGVPVLAVTPRRGQGTEAYILDVSPGITVWVPG
jgi:hypothetical protein